MADIQERDGAARDAADVMLRSVGGRAVLLRLPLPADANSVQEQVGLSLPSFQDVELAPAVFRKARPQIKSDGVVFWELLVSATSVEEVAGTLNNSETAGATALFAGAFGVLIDQVLYEIENLSATDVGGEPCVYRLVLRQPQSAL